MSEASLMSVALFDQSAKWRGRWVLYLVGLFCGMLATFPITIFSGFQRVQMDDGDSVQLHFVLEHSWRWLSDASYPATFWSPRVFYPVPLTLTYSENMIGAAPLYWMLRLCFSPDIALQWWLLLTAVLNYMAMLVVLRWLGIHPILAVLGGYVFAFNLPRQAQCIHFHLLPQWFTPFALYYFWSLTRRPSRLNWALLLITSAGQLLASVYLGWFLGFALAAWFIFLAGFDFAALRRMALFIRRNPVFITTTLVGWTTALLLFFQNYYSGNTDVRREYMETVRYSPTIPLWFAVQPDTHWAEFLLPDSPSRDPEDFLFCGFALYAMIPVALLAGWEARHNARTRQAALFMLTTALTCVFLMAISLHLGGEWSVWKLVFNYVPGANAIRAINRVCFVVIAIALPSGTAAIQHLADEKLKSNRTRNLVYSLLLLFCVLEQTRFGWTFTRRDQIEDRISRIATELKDADVAYVIPTSEENVDLVTIQVTSMMAGLRTNMPVINGYSGRYPDNYPAAVDASVPDLLKFLGTNWHGRLLIIEMTSPPKKRYYDVRDGVATPVP